MLNCFSDKNVATQTQSISFRCVPVLKSSWGPLIFSIRITNVYMEVQDMGGGRISVVMVAAGFQASQGLNCQRYSEADGHRVARIPILLSRSLFTVTFAISVSGVT